MTGPYRHGHGTEEPRVSFWRLVSDAAREHVEVGVKLALVGVGALLLVAAIAGLVLGIDWLADETPDDARERGAEIRVYCATLCEESDMPLTGVRFTPGNGGECVCGSEAP